MSGSRKLALAAAALVLSFGLAGAPTSSAEPPSGPLTTEQLRSLEVGVQLAPKGSAAVDRAAPAPNPYLANVPDLTTADYASWRTRLTGQAAERAKSSELQTAKRRAVGRALGPAVVHDEQEPAGTEGSNDSQPTAEIVDGFGTGSGDNPRVRVLGETAALPAPPTRALPVVAEDNGAIPSAGATGIDGNEGVVATGELGDGPHGPAPAGDGRNDFDFYKLQAQQGQVLTVNTAGSETGLDTVVAVYDTAGSLLAADDDGEPGPGLFSLLRFEVPAAGDYFVLVAGYATMGRTFPTDPFNSGSGLGGADTGDYRAIISTGQFDTDYYAFDLAAGDVLGATVTGSATTLTVFRLDGSQMVGSAQSDVSFIYAPESPLPGGGNTALAYVAEEPGLYAVRVDGPTGRYDATVEAYRPGSETDTARRVQTVFLDFDGARVNTAIWGGAGVRQLSPFSAFIARWGLTSAQEAALVDAITEEVRENIELDLRENGLNPNVAVRVINSKDQPDIFGRPNVSRVIVGGTIAQSGISTIGIAQFIDTGNYAHEDSALVLLDVLSNPSGAASLNTYMNDSSDRLAFVAQATGNVISHEIGHLVGSFHTDNVNTQLSLMDAGGTNFGNLFGVGPDGVGGTADDVDTDFTTDRYIPAEGFTGLENTLNVAAWAYSRGGRVTQP